jgi:hypothetical protein
MTDGLLRPSWVAAAELPFPSHEPIGNLQKDLSSPMINDIALPLRPIPALKGQVCGAQNDQ